MQKSHLFAGLALLGLAGVSPALPRGLERPGQPRKKLYLSGGKPFDPFAILDPPLVTLSRQQRRRREARLEKMRLKVERRRQDAHSLFQYRQKLAQEVALRAKMLIGNFRSQAQVS